MTKEFSSQPQAPDNTQEQDPSYNQAMDRRYARSTMLLFWASIALFIGCVAVGIGAILVAGWEPIGVLGVSGP